MEKRHLRTNSFGLLLMCYNTAPVCKFQAKAYTITCVVEYYQNAAADSVSQMLVDPKLLTMSLVHETIDGP